MKYTVAEFAEKFRIQLGDRMVDCPDSFIIRSLNWAFNDLPLVPRLGKLFSKHYTQNLDAKGHYKWKLDEDFRRISDTPMMKFWTSNGEKICELPVCYKDPVAFYSKNGIIELKKPGQPCEYTREEEDDNVYLVFDRPLDVPVIVDYIAYGFPKPIKSMDDTIELSAIAENLILSAMFSVYYKETSDFAFSGAISDYLDNKLIPEAIQALEKNYGSDNPVIIGEF